MSAPIPVGYGVVSIEFMLGEGVNRAMFITSGVLSPSLEPSAVEAAEVVHDVLTASGSLIEAAAMTSNYFYKGVRATMMRDEGPVVAYRPANIQGTMSGNSVPPNGSLLVRKVTNQGGRKNRGRWYIPPAFISEVNINAAGSFDGSVAQPLQDRLNVLWNEWINTQYEPCLIHSDGTQPTVVSGFVLEQTLATQRRRLR